MSVDKIIKVLKENNGALVITTICDKTGLSRNQVLVNVRRTLKLDKPKRNMDVVLYIEYPDLPEEFDDVLLDIKEPESIEQELIKYIDEKKDNPTKEAFQLYLINDRETYHNYDFDWNNKNSFKSAKKKVLRMLRETRETDL